MLSRSPRRFLRSSRPGARRRRAFALAPPGAAAVAGFAGAIPPVQIAPGVDPAAWTFIDWDGPSLRDRRPERLARAAERASRRRPQAVHRRRRADRPGLLGRARQRRPAQHLCRGEFGLRAADRRAGARRRRGAGRLRGRPRRARGVSRRRDLRERARLAPPRPRTTPRRRRASSPMASASKVMSGARQIRATMFV